MSSANTKALVVYQEALENTKDLGDPPVAFSSETDTITLKTLAKQLNTCIYLLAQQSLRIDRLEEKLQGILAARSSLEIPEESLEKAFSKLKISSNHKIGQSKGRRYSFLK